MATVTNTAYQPMPRNMPTPSKNLSKVPPVTPELLAENEKEQQQWREHYRVPAVGIETHAQRVIRDNLATIDALEKSLASAKYGEKRPIRNRIKQLRNDTAIWCESIGQFEAAADLTSCRHQRKLYRRKSDAVTRPDDEWCEHPTFENVDGVVSQNCTREQDVYSDKHGRVMPLLRCRICGFRNVRELPPELQKLSEHRAAAVAAGKDSRVNLVDIIR
jgi:hypothetical protein